MQDQDYSNRREFDSVRERIVKVEMMSSALEQSVGEVIKLVRDGSSGRPSVLDQLQSLIRQVELTRVALDASINDLKTTASVRLEKLEARTTALEQELQENKAERKKLLLATLSALGTAVMFVISKAADYFIK